MSITIYSPQVLAYARANSVTELQAYRALKSREAINRAQEQSKGFRRYFTRRTV